MHHARSLTAYSCDSMTQLAASREKQGHIPRFISVYLIRPYKVAREGAVVKQGVEASSTP
jgi:hypothetical protein